MILCLFSVKYRNLDIIQIYICLIILFFYFKWFFEKGILLEYNINSNFLKKAANIYQNSNRNFFWESSVEPISYFYCWCLNYNIWKPF